MKKFFILSIAVCVFLLSACTSSVDSAGTSEEAPHTEPAEFLETAASDPAPVGKVVGDLPDDEPTSDDTICIPEPFYYDDYGARYILVDGTIDEYRLDEDYWEVIETPESTAFSVISYWYSHSELRVQFRESGAWYIYYNFEPEMWLAFKNADSKGGYFNKWIKGFYEYERE